jgi:serine/threonine protein kinase
LEGASTLTQATDVYAFAILCIEVLAMGQVPWCLDDDESVRHFVLSKVLSFTVGDKFLIIYYLDLNKRPAIPVDFSSPLLHDLIGACWDKNPDNRPSFTSIIEKLRQLRHGADESDDLLHTPTIPEIPEEIMLPLSPQMSPKSFSPTFTCGYPDFNWLPR